VASGRWGLDLDGVLTASSYGVRVFLRPAVPHHHSPRKMVFYDLPPEDQSTGSLIRPVED
jgi:hypothetical protein